MPAGGGPRRGGRWLLRCAAAPWGRACAVPGERRGGPRPGNGSLPAEVSLDLVPGDVVTFFGDGDVEGLDVLGLLGSIEELLVALGADQDRCRSSVALEDDRLGTRGVDDLGELLPSLADADRRHARYRTTRTSICTEQGRWGPHGCPAESSWERQTARVPLTGGDDGREATDWVSRRGVRSLRWRRPARQLSPLQRGRPPRQGPRPRRAPHTARPSRRAPRGIRSRRSPRRTRLRPGRRSGLW